MQNGWKKSVWYNSRQKRNLLRPWNHPFKKYPKIYIFPWFLSKSADFSILCFNGKWINGHFSNFFLGNIGQENVFYDIQERKNTFLRYKNKKNSKSRKIDIFPKTLTHCFGPKMAIFPTFFFRQYRPGKCLLRYFTTKKRLSRLKKKKFKTLKNWHFSKGLTHCFAPKMAIFPTFLF